MDECKHKSFTLSVDLLLTIVLVLSILSGITFSLLNKKISVLQEKVGFLEDHDVEMQNLKQQLFVDMLKK